MIYNFKINDLPMYKKLKRKFWPNFMYVTKKNGCINLTINIYELVEENWDKDLSYFINNGIIDKNIAETYIKVHSNKKDMRLQKQFSKDLRANDWGILY